jgi:hypothetical protein
MIPKSSKQLRNYRSFYRFILEREQIRMDREFSGTWTAPDPVLEKYRFCNVDREHDRVTKFVKAHYRDTMEDASVTELVINLYLARVYNHPPTLLRLGTIRPVTKDRLLFEAQQMQEYQKTGAKLMRGAYMMGAHGPENKGRGVVEYFHSIAVQLLQYQESFAVCTSLEEVATIMLLVKGTGPFIVNQVCTDLRYCTLFKDASDWKTFLMCGPGTCRGIGHVFDLQHRPSSTPALAQKVLDLRDRVCEDLEQDDTLKARTIRKAFRDPNNIANCLCEFDKYVRAWSIELSEEVGGHVKLYHR